MQPVGDQGDELRIGGLALGVAHSVAEEALQGVQISSVPGNLDGVADGTFDAGRSGAECLGHLGVEDFRNGVGVLTARLGASWMGSVKPP